jgi:hypothetical protein
MIARHARLSSRNLEESGGKKKKERVTEGEVGRRIIELGVKDRCLPLVL